ncbi:MAG: type II secretion system F family protein [Candidatus Aenigmarchaeota archaeon]|nr:type II secretion system F family protein [Candidatus Aenigmarchaeota archaeon]
MSSSYTKFCYNLFGDFSRRIKDKFLDIEKDIKTGGLKYTLEEWISLAITTVGITFFLVAISLSVIFTILFKKISAAVLLSGTFSFVLSSIVLFLFYTYPAVKAKVNQSQVDKNLPFAITYLSSIASGESEPAMLFKAISKFKEYGKLAEESKEITRNIELFGMSTINAMRRQSAKTSSRKFGELLTGIIATLESGTSLFNFLKDKSELFMNEYRANIKKYTQKISLFVEVYLTLIIIGSIFFITLSSIMGIISAGTTIMMLQMFIVFIFLPLISISFIILIKSMSPD